MTGLALASGESLIKSDPDVISWLEQNFYIPEANNGPIRLAPYIKAALREALRRDENGDFVYSTIIWSDIKKSGKSSIAAGVALWFAYMLEWGSIKVIANDLEQADSRVAYYMRRAIALNPKMREEIKQRNYLIQLPNMTLIKAIPIDPEGEAGGNDDMIIFSELWGAVGAKAERMWTEATLPPNKHGRSFRWVETYAGFSGESVLLENLYNQVVRPEYQITLSEEYDRDKDRMVDFPGLEVYANPVTRMFCLWNTKPRLPWQTPSYYATEKAVIQNESEYGRIHENKWSASTKKFVDSNLWRACALSPKEFKELLDKHVLEPDDPMVAGIDAAVTRDNFAVSLVSRVDDTAYVRMTRLWVPPPGKREINFAGPEYFLRWLVTPADEFVQDDNDQPLPNPETGELERGLDLNIISFSYDPYQLVDMSQRLRRAGVGNFEPFNQNTLRAEADSLFQTLIYRRGVRHLNDPDLNRHMENANSQVTYIGNSDTGQPSKIRLVKKTTTDKIDLAVATSMAVYRIIKQYNV
ncbi:MAG: hypothetical protein BGO39_02890 [Chloroflexi bacterium 54-19]|nr:MAG: hypothetical protein BGO39_02890 [Chloroflexi bacterium 54-19]